MNPVDKIAGQGTGGEKLPLMESFYSIQGEGFHQGKAAWFLRLAGCDVGCVWCDVKDSWKAEAWPEVPVDTILEPVASSRAGMVVVTGGEPLLYELGGLTTAIHRAGKKAHLETSGTHPLTGKWDWICLSPKKFKKPLEEIYGMADELKVVVYNKTDFRWADETASRTRPGCRLFLQPEWSRQKTMVPLIVDFVKENPQWEISLQIHKYMNVR